MVSETGVLIAGAGPTGLTLACDLARRKVPFRLVDEALHLFEGSRAKGLQPRTLEVFEDLGIIEEVLASGADYPPFRVHLGPISVSAGRINKMRSATPDVPYPNLWLLPQRRTGELLSARLADLGGRVEFGVRVTGFEQTSTEVAVKLIGPDGPGLCRAAYLVGCDGGQSTTRKTLGLPLVGEELKGGPVVVGDVEVEGLDRRFWHLWPVAKGCILSLCPLPGTSCFQLQAGLRPRTAPLELNEPGILDLVHRAVGSGRLRLGRVLWWSLYRTLHARMARHYRVGRVFVAGDAAHVHPPSGGQGLNTGVQDAYNLGWKLAATLGGAPQALLDTYEAERLPIAASVLGLSKKLLRDKGIGRGSKTQQLDLNYRASPLAEDHRAKPGKLRAGDRAPDATGEDISGRRVRLFELLEGHHWSLLAFGFEPNALPSPTLSHWSPTVRLVRIAQAREIAGDDAFIDRNGHAARAYGVTSIALVLVRPDGYVGFMAEGDAWTELSAYLAGVTSGPISYGSR